MNAAFCSKYLKDILNLYIIPECHFPGTGFFLKKSGKFPVPSIREHPLPGPNSVQAFETGCFPVSFLVGKYSGIPERFLNENLSF